MQHGNGDDERQVEPVCHIDMRLFALQHGAEEDNEIGDPDDGEPDIDIPFRFSIFAALCDTEQVAGCSHYDKELIAPEYEPGQIATNEACATGTLHDIEG